MLNMRLRKLAALGAVTLLVVAGVAFVACNGSDDDTAGANTSVDEAAHVEGDGTAVADEAAHVDAADAGVRELTVAASDTFAYTPAELTLAAGERVRIMLDNTESALVHDFTVESIQVRDFTSEGVMHDMNESTDDGDVHEEASLDAEAPEVHVAVGPADTAYLEFTATEPGEYVFYCTVPGHREAGMEGTLIVR